MRFEMEVGGRIREVAVDRAGSRFIVNVDGREFRVDAAAASSGLLSLLIDGASHEIPLAPDTTTGRLIVHIGSAGLPVSLNGRRSSRRGGAAAGGGGPQRILAPMPGRVVRVLVRSGERVRARQPLIVVEAMKMENELRSLHDGMVSDVAVRDGQSVEAGTLLAVVDPEARP
jgi:biotin carboxyl carrier protein